MAYVAGAMGLGILGVGAFFGFRAGSKWHESNDHCPAGSCDPQGVSLAKDAKTAARIADVVIPFGLVGLGVGTYLYFASERKPAEGPQLRASPVVGPSYGGVGFRGAW